MSVSGGKKRRVRRGRVRLFVFIFLVIIAGGLFLSKKWWLPKLRGLGSGYGTIVNSGELAEGKFPVQVTGSSDFQVRYSDGYFVILSDAYVCFYSDDGELLKRRQHSYTNPVLRTAGDRTLVYESGGNEICVEDSEDSIYTKEHSENIMFAEISREGFTAVVTSSENYECEIFVYDRKGELIYDRKCVERVTDISFRDESMGCDVSYIKAENGSLVTSVQEIDFTQDKEKWTSPGLDTVGFEVYSSDKGVFVMGADSCGYIDSSGQIVSYYRYDGQLEGGGSCGDGSAVIVNNDSRRKYMLVLFDSTGREPKVLEMESPLKDVTVSEELVYVMTKDMILAYDFDGTLHATVGISDSYTGFVRGGEYIFLRAFNKIDRIDYNV